MQIVHKKDSEEHKNTKSCAAYEYPMNKKNITGALVNIDGRCLDIGYAVNLKCKEISYVINGSGLIAIENKEISISERDLILIDINEKYFWKGSMELFVSCTPSWLINQHKYIK